MRNHPIVWFVAVLVLMFVVLRFAAAAGVLPVLVITGLAGLVYFWFRLLQRFLMPIFIGWQLFQRLQDQRNRNSRRQPTEDEPSSENTRDRVIHICPKCGCQKPQHQDCPRCDESCRN